MRHPVVSSTAVALILGSVAFALADGPPRRRTPIHADLSPEMQRLAALPVMAPRERLEPRWKKVGVSLREAMGRLQLRGVTVAEATAADLDPLLKWPLRHRPDGAVRVTVRVSRLGTSQERLLRTSGLDVGFASRGHLFVEGWARLDRIEAMARLAFVKGIAPTLPPMRSSGSVLSEGDTIHQADQARTQLAVDGSGIKVGVISDSVDGLSSAVASGDLPANVQVLNAGQGSGEGTAMLEIVHDLAPGAPLAFFGPSSSGEMITGLNQLAAAGARVIVDDLTFFDQPHFEEGPIAQTVNVHAGNGIVLATSAGNFAASTGDRGHYEADYLGFGQGVGGGTNDPHDFGSGELLQFVDVPAGRVGVVFLQWSNPFGQSGDDYDLYVLDSNLIFIGSSTDAQDGNDNPVEFVALDNSGSGTTKRFSLLVDRFSGLPQRLEMYVSGVSRIAFTTSEGSIAGHANASGIITVASINAADTGNDDAAEYSSRGPAKIFFPAAEDRSKPEIAAIDGVMVTGAAGFPSPFFGTSAAAPHLAAIAALMLDRNPAATPAEIRQALQQTAVDLGATGFDFTFGSGRADALAAAQAIGAGPGGVSPVITALQARLDGGDVMVTYSGNDADGDVAEQRISLLDGTGAEVGSTGFQAQPMLSGLTSWIDFQDSASGVAQFPTAVDVGVTLRDGQGNASNQAVVPIDQADPGGPGVIAVVFNGRRNRLKIAGSGFLGTPSVELNGTEFPFDSAFRVNKKGRLLKFKPVASLFGSALLPGANRIRIKNNGLFSNILILNL